MAKSGWQQLHYDYTTDFVSGKIGILLKTKLFSSVQYLNGILSPVHGNLSQHRFNHFYVTVKSAFD